MIGGTDVDTKVKHLAQEIRTLTNEERDELATEALPLLLQTKSGLIGIDNTLQTLSDEELIALVEDARIKNRDIPEPTLTMVIGDALRAARSARRS